MYGFSYLFRAFTTVVGGGRDVRPLVEGQRVVQAHLKHQPISIQQAPSAYTSRYTDSGPPKSRFTGGIAPVLRLPPAHRSTLLGRIHLGSFLAGKRKLEKERRHFFKGAQA
jgi:hypothetical protein